MEEMGRAAMGILLVDLMVEVARAVKARMEALATMEDRKAALDQEATEVQTATPAQETTDNRMDILAQEAMEDQMKTLVQEVTEDRKKAQAPIMDLASRTQALSHKSTCTQRS